MSFTGDESFHLLDEILCREFPLLCGGKRGNAKGKDKK
jgi:hypothetical protein